LTKEVDVNKKRFNGKEELIAADQVKQVPHALKCFEAISFGEFTSSWFCVRVFVSYAIYSAMQRDCFVQIYCIFHQIIANLYPPPMDF
jgi:hypothetical protein